MIGLDTNVLVRCITQDDPVQAEQAAGCDTTFSFDSRLCDHPLARLPE